MEKITWLVPEKYQCLSGSWLKVIAMTAMLIDHMAAFILQFNTSFVEPLFTIGGRSVSWYMLMRLVGRIAFPLFAFLLVEGFLHTRDRRRYGRNLLIFALISELPWNLTHTGTLLCGSQNVFFTLLLGYLGLCVVERFKDDIKRMSLVLLLMVAACILIRADYGCSGFGFILLLYVLRTNRIFQTIIGACLLPNTWKDGLAFIPINLYNGKRGFIGKGWAKYIFYVFYPAHLFLIYLIQLQVFHH